MPAPAVIPAPIAYIIDVAVETFVVGLCLLKHCATEGGAVLSAETVRRVCVLHVSNAFYFE